MYAIRSYYESGSNWPKQASRDLLPLPLYGLGRCSHSAVNIRVAFFGIGPDIEMNVAAWFVIDMQVSPSYNFV